MRLESAIQASREGLNVHGSALSVIGDNISNSSTTGYKQSRIEFGDLIPDGGSSSASSGKGSSGSGVQVQQVRQIHTSGLLEPTGRALDMGIGGNGFFMIGDAANPNFTRAGNFSINEEGFLVTADGQTVLGLPDGGAELAALNVAGVAINGEATTTVTHIGNLDSRSAIAEAPDNPASFNELAGAASFSTSAEVFDSLGEQHDVQIMYFKTGTNTFEARAYIDSGDTGGTEGTPQLLGTATLTFNSSGQIEEANQAAAQMTVTPAYSNGATAGSFTINLSGFSQFASGSAVNSTAQDGQGTGNIVSFEVGSGGTLSAVLDNGNREPVGVLQLASFNNLDALQRSGNNAFTLGGGAGDRIQGAPGTAGFGVVEGGVLERSTVDISTEFVNMVVFQRGYQANSQALSAVTGLMQQTIALLR
ncbi:MAG: flagellar hook protein FlgE [Bdellovibrionota bacterium]